MSKETEMIDLVRSIMYGGAEKADDLLLQEINDLAQKLAEYDDVPADPFANRLITLIGLIKAVRPDIYHDVNHLNDK